MATSNEAERIPADENCSPVRAFETSGGEVAWAADHEPFGRARTYVPGSVQAPGVEVSLRYPGQVADAETGLHYNWHRHYDPETGRYLQPEPLLSVPFIGMASRALARRVGRTIGEMPAYAYAYNNPAMYIDRNGFAAVVNHSDVPIPASGNPGSGQGSGTQQDITIPPGGTVNADNPQNGVGDVDFIFGDENSGSKIRGTDTWPTWHCYNNGSFNVTCTPLPPWAFCLLNPSAESCKKPDPCKK